MPFCRNPEMGWILAVFLIATCCLNPASSPAQTRFLRDGNSGITVALANLSQDNLEWYPPLAFSIAYTHRGRWDLGLRYGKEVYHDYFGNDGPEDSGKGVFANHVLIVPGKPDGFGVELQAAFNAQRGETVLPKLNDPFGSISGNYHEFQRVYRAGVRLWQQPRKDFCWGLGVFNRVRQEQLRDNADDQVLVGQDFWELGFQLDLDVLFGRYFNLFLRQELSQDRSREEWRLEPAFGLGLQFNLSGGK